jgi:hypothetical protein
VWAAAAVAFLPALQPPSIFEPGLFAPKVTGRVLQSSAELPPDVWGGGYATESGEPVDLWVSREYAEDRAVGQRWVDYLGQLEHGSELSHVTVFLGKPDDVEFLCGYGAIACYSPKDALIMAPGEDVLGSVTAEAALTHEYGHHVSQNRLNPPWRASEYGTKRWATHVGVCAGVAAKRLFPGDEAGHYRQNPSEIFAESYRLLNERRLGRMESAWRIVDRRYYPDEAALRALDQDVVLPWRANTTFTRTARGPRAFTISTPLDGTIGIRLAGARYRLALADPAGKVVARTSARGMHGLVCGERSLTVRVSGPPRGAFSLRISRP